MNSENVHLFLTHFKEKMKVFNVIFRDDRGKNKAALAELEITAFDRIKILDRLEVDDYSEGPITGKLNLQSDMWVFGKVIKGKEVYIKITIGFPSSSTICISFHPAEHPMQYPLKYLDNK